MSDQHTISYAKAVKTIKGKKGGGELSFKKGEVITLLTKNDEKGLFQVSRVLDKILIT